MSTLVGFPKLEFGDFFTNLVLVVVEEELEALFENKHPMLFDWFCFVLLCFAYYFVNFGLATGLQQSQSQKKSQARETDP